MMKFSEVLEKAKADKPPRLWTPRPEVLLLPQIPKPMHGMAPRVVLGDKWWQETRQAAYLSTDNHCIACCIEKAKAPLGWLEGHEVYKTDYVKGRMKYLETVALCHYCHNYIHQGRLQAMLDQGKITHAKYAAVIQHGDRVVANAGLSKPLPYEGPIAEWHKWRLVIGRKTYKPKFVSMQEWMEHFGITEE